MVLDNYRRVLDWWLDPMASSLRRVHPDTLTWISLAFAILGGLAFWRSGPGAALMLLWAGWVLVGLNSIFDLLDGKVAKLTHKMTPRGDFLDHAIDRFSDTLFIGGLALSSWSPRPAIGLAALAGTLLTSYMGTQAQAVGLKRHYGGLLGRADRMVLLLFAPLIQMVLEAYGHHDFEVLGHTTNTLELVLLYFAVVGLITCIQRFATVLGSFGADGKLP